MGGRSSRGGAHSSITLIGSRGRHGGGNSRGGWNISGGGGGRAWIGAADRGRGRAAHPRPEGVSPAGLHHVWVRE